MGTVHRKKRKNTKTKRKKKGGNPSGIDIKLEYGDNGGELVEYEIGERLDRDAYADRNKLYPVDNGQSWFDYNNIYDKTQAFFTMPGSQNNETSVRRINIAINDEDDMMKSAVLNEMIRRFNAMRNKNLRRERVMGGGVTGGGYAATGGAKMGNPQVVDIDPSDLTQSMTPQKREIANKLIESGSFGKALEPYGATPVFTRKPREVVPAPTLAQAPATNESSSNIDPHLLGHGSEEQSPFLGRNPTVAKKTVYKEPATTVIAGPAPAGPAPAGTAPEGKAPVIPPRTSKVPPSVSSSSKSSAVAPAPAPAGTAPEGKAPVIPPRTPKVSPSVSSSSVSSAVAPAPAPEGKAPAPAPAGTAPTATATAIQPTVSSSSVSSAAKSSTQGFTPPPRIPRPNPALEAAKQAHALAVAKQAKALEEATSELNKAHQTVVEKTKENDANGEAIKLLSSTNEKLKLELKEKKENYESQKSQLTTEISARQEEIKANLKLLEEVTQEKQAISEEKLKLDSAKAELEANVERIETELKKLTTLSEEDKTRLTNELKTKEKLLAELTASEQEAKTKTSALQEQANLLQEEINALQLRTASSIDHLKQILGYKETELAKVQGEFQKASVEFANKEKAFQIESTRLTQENSKIQALLNDATNINKKTAEEKAALQDTLNSNIAYLKKLEAQFRTTRDENNQLKSRTNAFEREIVNLRNDLKSAQASIAEKEKEKSALGVQLAQKQTKIKSLEEINSRNNEQITNLRAELNTKRNEIQELNKTQQQNEEEINILKAVLARKEADVLQLEALKNKTENEKILLINEFDDTKQKVTDLETQKTELERTIDQKNTEIASLEASYAAKEQENQAIKAELVNARAEIMRINLVNEEKEAENQKLQTELLQKQTDYMKINRELQEEKQLKSDIEFEKQLLEKQLQNKQKLLKSQQIAANAERVSQDAEIARLQNDLEREKPKLEALKTSQIALEAKLKQKETEYTAEILRLTGENQTLFKEVSDKQAEIDQLRNTISTEIPRLQSEIAEKTAEIAKITAEKQAAEQALAAATAEWDVLKAGLDTQVGDLTRDLANTNTNCNAEKAVLNTEVDKLKIQKSNLEQNLNDSQTKCTEDMRLLQQQLVSQGYPTNSRVQPRTTRRKVSALPSRNKFTIKKSTSQPVLPPLVIRNRNMMQQATPPTTPRSNLSQGLSTGTPEGTPRPVTPLGLQLGFPQSSPPGTARSDFSSGDFFEPQPANNPFVAPVSNPAANQPTNQVVTQNTSQQAIQSVTSQLANLPPAPLVSNQAANQGITLNTSSSVNPAAKPLVADSNAVPKTDVNQYGMEDVTNLFNSINLASLPKETQSSLEKLLEMTKQIETEKEKLKRENEVKEELLKSSKIEFTPYNLWNLQKIEEEIDKTSREHSVLLQKKEGAEESLSKTKDKGEKEKLANQIKQLNIEMAPLEKKTEALLSALRGNKEYKKREEDKLIARDNLWRPFLKYCYDEMLKFIPKNINNLTQANLQTMYPPRLAERLFKNLNCLKIIIQEKTFILKTMVSDLKKCNENQLDIVELGALLYNLPNFTKTDQIEWKEHIINNFENKLSKQPEKFKISDENTFQFANRNTAYKDQTGKATELENISPIEPQTAVELAPTPQFEKGNKVTYNGNEFVIAKKDESNKPVKYTLTREVNINNKIKIETKFDVKGNEMTLVSEKPPTPPSASAQTQSVQPPAPPSNNGTPLPSSGNNNAFTSVLSGIVGRTPAAAAKSRVNFLSEINTANSVIANSDKSKTFNLQGIEDVTNQVGEIVKKPPDTALKSGLQTFDEGDKVQYNGNPYFVVKVTGTMPKKKTYDLSRTENGTPTESGIKNDELTKL